MNCIKTKQILDYRDSKDWGTGVEQQHDGWTFTHDSTPIKLLPYRSETIALKIPSSN